MSEKKDKVSGIPIRNGSGGIIVRNGAIMRKGIGALPAPTFGVPGRLREGVAAPAVAVRADVPKTAGPISVMPAGRKPKE